ncbi:hypothetical protein G3O08_09845 [Cryomorpha ignava]|uniref:Uncharacterized protein n=1 Tax=Cryomorpha ignava TaxID=101383 RepID=A0A7K3WQ70_9FLAO|nr:class I lanthipeptide [Cryomorpha ignava]NEN23803.1 hypothetical protein [Cryomorpha ignava]
MKKIKLDGRLSLNKETIALLNEDQMKNINGGGFLSLFGKSCRNKEPDTDINSTPQNNATCEGAANTCVYVDGC